MSIKYYAVKKGFNTGIFTDWPTAQKCVSGFKGAEFKSFKTIEDAQIYISGYIEVDDSTSSLNNEIVVTEDTSYSAYVDGSFKDGKVGYGIVILKDDEIILKESGNALVTDLTARNVIGELASIIKLTELCRNMSINNIRVYYDYEGIEKWATGVWSAGIPLTKAYVKYIKNISDIKISFKKVPAHSGIKYNEVVDELAKAGINSFSCVNIDLFISKFI